MSTSTFKAVSVSLPTDVLRRIDVIARESYKSRSDVIREALIERAVPVYTPTKEEACALDQAKCEREKGDVTPWDEFVKTV